MSQIKKPGVYQVVLENCHYERSPKGNGAFARLTGRTEEDETITASRNCTTTLIQSGRNCGQPWWKVTMQELEDLFVLTDPAAIETLNGKPCEFVVEEEEYKGQKKLVVKYINAARPAMKKEEVAALFKAMQSGGPGMAMAAPAAVAAEPDDPFAEGGSGDPNDLPI